MALKAKLGGGGGTCLLCKKTCFLAEALRTATEQLYHSHCFRCTQCRRPLTLISVSTDSGSHKVQHYLLAILHKIEIISRFKRGTSRF